jgi:transaldolase
MDDVGWPDPAAALIRTESTRNCWPSSLLRSAAVTDAILRRLPHSLGFLLVAQSRLHELATHGVSTWVDSLSREMLETGELRRLMEEDAAVGVTSNPTIFEKALSTGDWYDGQLREELASEDDAKEIFLALAVQDVQRACDLMRPVWERTGGVDGYVSLEVDPELAYERAPTFDEARRLTELVDRPNLLVKIPATEPGLGAIEDSIAEARSINVTLIFSLERYAAVTEAYVRGLERLLEAGGDPSRVASVASFFVSRVDTETDKRLAALGREDLQGMLAVANAKLAYETYLEVFSGERWERLAAAGARPQRCLWASTSTKNPAYRDVLYVEELIGPDTVNTMPLETIEAFQDHGVSHDTLTAGVGEAHALLDELAAAGIDYEDVVAVLETEGVQKFADSFHALLDGISAKRAALGL